MGKLNLILLFCLLFLLQIAYWQKRRADDMEKQKDLYKQNNHVLITRIKKVYNDKVETDRANEELRQAIREDKNSSFNWSENISSTLPILSLKRMHKERSNLR